MRLLSLSLCIITGRVTVTRRGRLNVRAFDHGKYDVGTIKRRAILRGKDGATFNGRNSESVYAIRVIL